MSKKITLKQMEAELHQWGGVYVDRVMRGNDKANRYEVNDPEGKRVAIGFERREVLETAYAEMQSRNAQIPTETQASETPTAPQVDERPNIVSGDFVLLDILPDMMQEKNERIAKLEAELQKANRVAAAFDAELSKEQQKRIKLEADNAAYERIIIQAGKDFAALKDENARMKEAIMKVLRNIRLDEQDALDDLAAIFTIVSGKDSTPTPPAQEAPALKSPLPKFTVGQAVWVVFSYGREFGLSNKAATVIEIKQEDGANWYRVKYELSNEEGSQWWEEYEICRRDYVPATPKRPVATRCRVNWNHRGFSSGSYEVLGYSQEKQVYVLNISTDSDKPMPKTVKMADCAVVS